MYAETKTQPQPQPQPQPRSPFVNSNSNSTQATASASAPARLPRTTTRTKTKCNGMKLGGFEIAFVPYDTSLEEHLQTLAVALNVFFITCGLTIAPILLLYVLLYTRFWFLVVLYVAWIYYDSEIGFKGGRKWPWYRRNVIFKYFRDYFPCNLIKTQDLTADKNYLFVVYPHGVMSYSTVSCFASEANHIESRVFPGLDFRVVTLDINFYSPISREHFLSLGGIGSKESSITHVLNSEPSKAVVLIAGGAAEARFATAGNVYRIVINRRKGFVRLALKTGSWLVPVFSFGENNYYEQYQSKWLTKIQLTMKRLTGIYPVIPKGRGIFQYTFGLLPNREPTNTVVGKPIEIPKIANPRDEDIDHYHAIYVRDLRELFETHKCEYDAAGENATLIML